ncbi:unnamed protein product [Withania somnifera]
MEYNKEKKTGPWLSVPQFGHWDQKGVYPDYSMDFSKIRENRKQNKKDLSRASFGNENELIFSTKKDANSVYSPHSNDQQYHKNQNPNMLAYLFSHMQYFRCYCKDFIY